MRYVARAILLTAVIVMAGCNVFRDPNVYDAVVSSFEAPDTVHAGTAHNVTAHLVLGAQGGCVLDHAKITHTLTQVELHVWARDTSNGNPTVTRPTDEDLTFEVRPTAPGAFRLFAPNPDRKPIEKTITVLP